MARSPIALRKYLRRLKDPRIDRNKRHSVMRTGYAIIGGSRTACIGKWT
jgi:hypothetical protein